MQRSSREFRIACELVRNGVIEVKRTAVNIGGPGRPCDLKTEKDEPGLDWDMWIGSALCVVIAGPEPACAWTFPSLA